MKACLSDQLRPFMQGIMERNPGESEFHQAVYEVARDIIPFMDTNPVYRDLRILERLTEADRIIIFRVTWEDDSGQIQTNRGYRVQHSNAIGPYKGGTRFKDGLRLCVLKALAFEQTFKNSLTGLPMGGAKGGANFNPKGRSEREIMHFCQQYMMELARHIGPNIDVPAGDVGVGQREISYMFGQYKRISNEFSGVLTGKGVSFGGSLIRKEATGYGCVYMLDKVLRQHKEKLEGKRVLVSGAGNVAMHVAEKLVELGARVLTLSDSTGFVLEEGGFDEKVIGEIKEKKFEDRQSFKEMAKELRLRFFPGKKPWGVPCQIAMPCAIQNEIREEDAQELLVNGCMAVVEGANMPCHKDAVEFFIRAGIIFVPAKAANAGGVAVSGMEMTQNSMRLSWTREELDRRLHDVMDQIHERCLRYGTEANGYVNYRKGANISGFIKVADAIRSCGIV